MIPGIPVILPMPFAQNGERRDIPDNNTTPGSADASWAVGFPPVTRISKQAGGKPPYGLDFQGIFHALSQHLFFAQSGGVYPWQGANGAFPGLDYLTGAHVLGSDGSEYVALMPSGPDVPNTEGAGFVGPKDPVTDAEAKGGYWSRVFNGGPNGGAVGGAVYELGEFYSFRNPTLRPGFQPCQGGVLQQAATLYPQIWAYLQTSEGQNLCVTEAEWQAMTRATWGSGTFKASWNGIGGAPYFVQDLEAGTLRMPDLRGMFECATDSTLAVGQAQGDCIRNATGNVYGVVHKGYLGYHGMMYSSVSSPSEYLGMSSATSHHLQPGHFSTTLSVAIPTGPVITPKAWGVLTCAYLGQPAAA